MTSVERFRNSLNNERTSFEGIQDVSGGATTITGEFLIRGTGEKIVEVSFPCAFTEKPIMSFGGEVLDSEFLIQKQFPTISVLVAGWITKEVPPFSRLFTGCKLCIVTTGPQTQSIVVYWSMDGLTITNFGS
jgi:hypothetical protein